MYKGPRNKDTMPKGKNYKRAKSYPSQAMIIASKYDALAQKLTKERSKGDDGKTESKTFIRREQS